MSRIVVALLALALLGAPAGGQTMLNYVPLNLAGGTMTGELTTVASATGTAGLNLPAGVAPTAPVNGDLWSTTAGLFARINGATVGPLASIGILEGDGRAIVAESEMRAPDPAAIEAAARRRRALRYGLR